jgi:hypothetical protein
MIKITTYRPPREFQIPNRPPREFQIPNRPPREFQIPNSLFTENTTERPPRDFQIPNSVLTENDQNNYLPLPTRDFLIPMFILLNMIKITSYHKITTYYPPRDSPDMSN